MNISIVNKSNPWLQNSSSANRLLSLVNGLLGQGAIIKLYFYGGYTSVNELKTWKTKGDYNRVEYEYLNTKVVEGYWKVRWHNYVGFHMHKIKLLLALFSRVIEDKGIIWTDTLQFGFELAYGLKKQYPAIKVFTEVSEFLDIQQYNKGNFLQRLVESKRQKYFEQKAFYAYDGIALMTKTLMKYCESIPPPHPKFLHLTMTVDLARFTGNINPLPEFQKPYIAFVGVMNDAKDGVSILIHAFQRIANKFPDYKLYLVGGRNYDTPFHLKLIHEYGLAKRVFWMKEYARDHIPQIICHADLLVLPRPNSKQAQGGFPTKLGEYLATGNPVCATRVGEIPDYLNDNESVFFAEPGSVESFAEAIDRALGNPSIARKVGETGKKVAEQEFNKDIQATKLYDFLKELGGNLMA
jgi:glycosyltransferase involved in cell wall biosynthesis